MFFYVKAIAGEVSYILCVFSDSVLLEEWFDIYLDDVGTCLKFQICLR